MSRIRKSLKITRKTFFDPKGWLDWDFLKTESTNLFYSVKDNFDVPEAGQPVTFDEAMLREGLTEEELVNIARRYRTYAFVFLFLAFLMFIWGFALLFGQGILSGWILALAVCALFGSQAFRYDFWYFQIKQRRLDITYADWKRQYLGDNKGKKS